MRGMQLERIIDAETLTGRKKESVRRTEAERADVARRTTTGRTAARTLRHAWVLRKADAAPDGPHWTDAQIGDAYGVSLNTMGRLRQAFVDEGLAAALRGRPRPAPRPRTMDGEQEAQLVALRCGPVPGGQARWTVRLLAERFVQLAGSVAVSRETVRRTLNKTAAHALAADGMVHAPRAER